MKQSIRITLILLAVALLLPLVASTYWVTLLTQVFIFGMLALSADLILGNAGLFYLKRNPLNLPVPQLSSKFNVELRLGRSGSSYVAAVKTNVASGSIRAQGRLNGRVSSPYSLDKTNDFTKLFGALSKQELQ